MSEEKSTELQKQTYGTGEQYVLVPADRVEAQKAKIKPTEELPEKVLTQDGKVINLDTGAINQNPRIVNLCGRHVDLDDFGHRGEGFITELYEQWLGAVQSELVTSFSEMDEGYSNSLKILDYFDNRSDSMLRSKIVWRTEGEAKKGYYVWNQETTFEEWMYMTAATLRWRLKYEIDKRLITQALSSEDIRQAKHLVEECLIVVEKWLALPEAKQLISV